jgi:hypothetical protein
LLLRWLPRRWLKLRKRFFHLFGGQAKVQVEPDVSFDDGVLDVLQMKSFKILVPGENISGYGVRDEFSSLIL